MSQKPAPIVIDLPRKGVVSLVIDGHPFTANFDDADLLRDLLALNQRIEAVTEGEDTEGKLARLLEFAGDARKLIDDFLGEGAHATLFGEGKLPIVRVLYLVTRLATAAGPAYDAMFAEYTTP